jgi:hypothetical protein
MFWNNTAKLERRIEVLIRYIVRWRRNDMANWSDLAAKIIELKRETERVFAVLNDVRDRLEKCMAADAVDQAEIQAAHDAVAEVVAQMDHEIHADGV